MSETTTALLISRPGVTGVIAFNTRLGAVPNAKLGATQRTSAPMGVQFHPAPDAPKNTAPTGSVSVTTMFPRSLVRLRLHPPPLEPLSPAASSRTYNRQVPFGSAPLKTDIVAV